jgi:hypothetical protein
METSTPGATKAAAQTREPEEHAPVSAPVTRAAGADARFTIGPGVSRAATVATYERKPGDPVYRPLQIFTLDSAARSTDGAMAVINVPYEELTRGPKGSLFEVEAADGDVALTAVDLDDHRVLITQGLRPSAANHQFHQQMVYAVCSSVYATFRTALGRRIAWGFDRKDEKGVTRLKLRPHVAREGANAVYDPIAGEIRFGYFPAPEPEDGVPKGRNVAGSPVFTCLSHDIIVHELTHALIDGMRSHFLEPTGPDVAGFHEGFADLMAILQHFNYEGVVRSQILQSNGHLDRTGLLLGIAESFGLTLGTGGTLRSAIDSASARRLYSRNLEAHELGSVFLSAVFDAYCSIYERKIRRFRRIAGDHETLSAELADVLTTEASKLANQFLLLCVRALDYCPPVDLELGEFLRALITADRDLVPDDPWGYREAFIDRFAARGIYPAHVMQLSEEALGWSGLQRPMPNIQRLSFAELRFAGDPASPASADELEEQARALGTIATQPENLVLFGLVAANDPTLGDSRVAPPCVQSIRTSRRVGPDGQIVFDLIAEVTQSRFVRDPVDHAEREFVGGATLILGPNGDIRYAIVKSILNEKRLARQLAFQRSGGNGRIFGRAQVL